MGYKTCSNKVFLLLYLGLGMCMASPRRAPYSPRRLEGVGRLASPCRRENHDYDVDNI
jgi:hypothetical protein